MCCIFGIGLLQGHKLESESTLIGVISRLFKEAESGGRRASGISIMREKSVHVLRRPIPASKFISTTEYLNFMTDNLKLHDEENRVMSVIGHCRLPTKGSPENNLNNHPQVIGNIIGVHNGVIGNDDELFDSFSALVDRKAEVDTEIIFQLINHFNKSQNSRTIDAIKKTTPYLRGGYACAMHNTKQPYNMYLFRHGNPIKILHYADIGAMFFATREHFMEDAFEKFVNFSGRKTPINVLDNHGIAFNFWQKTMHKFSFRHKQTEKHA